METVSAWYAACTRWDFDALAELLDDTYSHTTLPATADDGVKGKAGGIAHARAVSSLLGGKPIEYEIFESVESDGRIWVHSRLFGAAESGPTFNNESIFLFTLTQAGRDASPKIGQIKEFVDTKMLDEFKKGMAKQ